MRGDGITFDPAVGVVLGSGLGVQGVLVAGERAAVEAELVGVGNKSVVPLVFITLGPWDMFMATYATA
jgi:hypothetical protein